MSLEVQSWDAYQNDDKVLELTATTNGSIAGDTYQFDLVNGSDELKVRKTSGAGITIADAGSSTTPGVVEVDLTDDLELDAGAYTWQFRRTNAGREDTLAAGDLSLGVSYRDLEVV